LIGGNYDEAISAFKASENAYPTFHQVFELSKFLASHMKELSDVEKRRGLLKTILDRYSYGMPEDVRAEFLRHSS
jgi:hypothetical protein